MEVLFANILGNTSVIELLIILVSKAIEVTMGTLRHILVNKGYKKEGAILAFFEIILWVFIASRVITNISAAPIKGVVYSLGYALGVYFGSKVENKLAFGKILIQVNTSVDHSELLAATLRDFGLGVTTLEAKGKDSDRIILMTYTNRKGKEVIFNLIRDVDPEAMITENDVSTLSGGYVSSWRRISK
ncbi:MAG TPA: DUF2179 domain-containing protein [Acholeplasmataceae bacterium]|nr:DUF2179 domain-containing protein [Acholeplasmataceae bacterium]